MNRVLLRAQSGSRAGAGHEMRTRAVAEEVDARGGAALLLVDDEESAVRLRRAGFEAACVLARPSWALEPAAGAWIDGFRSDWSDDVRRLARRRTPSYLVENRTRAREWASFVVQPNLHADRDAWERVHAARVLCGPRWIPLRREVRAVHASERRDVDLLVSFGGSDPLRSTERVLAALPRGTRVAVSVGAHMHARRTEIERAARHLAADVLADSAALAPWMARARLAITALGTTLYELAHLRTPALILANYDADRPVLEWYRGAGPFRPLGLARELDDAALRGALAAALAQEFVLAPRIPELGEGAANLAERLLGREHAALAA